MPITLIDKNILTIRINTLNNCLNQGRIEKIRRVLEKTIYEINNSVVSHIKTSHLIIILEKLTMIQRLSISEAKDDVYIEVLNQFNGIFNLLNT